MDRRRGENDGPTDGRTGETDNGEVRLTDHGRTDGSNSWAGPEHEVGGRIDGRSEYLTDRSENRQTDGHVRKPADERDGSESRQTDESESQQTDESESQMTDGSESQQTDGSESRQPDERVELRKRRWTEGRTIRPPEEQSAGTDGRGEWTDGRGEWTDGRDEWTDGRGERTNGPADRREDDGWTDEKEGRRWTDGQKNRRED